MAETIAIAGALAQRPKVGGHAWMFLQYLLGLRQLGWEVLFIDRLERDMSRDVAGAPCAPHDSVNIRLFTALMERFGLDGAFALILEGAPEPVGVSRDELLKRVRCSTLLINVMGYLNDEEILDSAPRRVFLDIDPGFGQMWRELDLHDPFAGHDDFVTIGLNVGETGCGVPTCGLEWIASPQPIVLDCWPAWSGGEHFTSVASWRGPFGPIDYGHRTYGLRVHEFRTFAELPRLTDQATFELALDIDPVEVRDIDLLERNGWSLVDPGLVAGDPDAYRRYIQSSKAEFSVAKNMYVETRSGWFSDRSLCYLASGKPVLAQDTGFTRHLPDGEGLLSFTTLKEAAAGVAEILGDYPRHAEAAQRIAEEHFDSRKVLSRLLEELEVV